MQTVGGYAVDPVVLGDLTEDVVGGGALGVRQVRHDTLVGDDAVDRGLDLRATGPGQVQRFQILDRV